MRLAGVDYYDRTYHGGTSHGDPPYRYRFRVDCECGTTSRVRRRAGRLGTVTCQPCGTTADLAELVAAAGLELEA